MNGDFEFTIKANILTLEGRELYDKLTDLRRKWQLNHQIKQEGWDYIKASLDADDATLDSLYA